METLDLPTITGFETPAAITAVAAAASTALDLRKVDLTDVALAQFGEWRKDVAAVKANLSTLALDLTTQTKVDEAKSLRWRVIGIPRAAARSTSKDLKSKLAKVSKAIGAEEDAIVLAYDEAESLITPHIDARQAELDAEKERERAAKAEAARLEAERVQRHEDGITTLAGYVGKAKGKTAAQIAKGIEFVAGLPIDPAHWQEYTERAAVTLAKTRETLRAMHAAQVKAEADAAELEALRAEKAARERREREEAEAAARAESERMAEAKRQADETAVLAASIRAESRRVEWPKNPAYIRKAMGTFECMAPDWENDPRDAVREAIAEGRSYLAALMSDALAAEREAREHSELEAERIADLEAGAPKPQDAELALAEALILQDTMTLPEGGGTIIVVAPDSGKDWEQALRGNGEPAPADVPLIRGEIGSIVGRVNITTVPDSEMTAGWSLPKTEPAPPPVEAPAADPAALEPTITIGDINTRLGFLVTADLVIGLGFVRQVRIGRGVHFLASEWPRLCDALTAHIKAKREAY